ncbi:MAG: type II toxin-antitoxin system Phd/YefM family antitoxin [Lentisphaerae bacterium]|nr:type II toxin-antitoxin system Phd/YefM family antitoxin [Lentisphaerota bacterium]
MITVSTMEVRSGIGDILNRVALRGDEYLVTRKGKPLAVMMPVEKAESTRRAARLRLNGWLSEPGSLKTDAEAMALANEARRAARRLK